MNGSEHTRASLVLRLSDPADEQAWQEFLQIYEGLLQRLAARWGLQPSDADEVVQETLLAVSEAVPRFRSAGHAGAFRGWLAAIARHKLADHLASRSKSPRGTGDTEVHRWLQQQAGDAPGESLWDWQQKKQIYLWAAAKVRRQVEAKTWEAFYRTTIAGEEVAVVAERLAMREGMIYVARSRVMSRLRKVVQTWSDAPDGLSLGERPQDESCERGELS